jgi:hypothetical protein
VRRRQSIEERSSSEGAHPKGAESDAKEGLRWWEPVRQTPGWWGKRLRRSDMDGRD